MQEIINEILLTEEKAKKAIDDARDTAIRNKSTLELELSNMLKTAREQVQEQMNQELEQARTSAEIELKNAKLQAEVESQNLLKQNQVKIDSLLTKVINILTKPEIKRE